MKKFFRQSIIFIFTGLVIFLLLFIIAEIYDPQVDYRIKQLLNKADSIEAIAVGNSHACALDFNILGINGYRIALGGNDIFESEYQIRTLVPKLPNLKTVFFNISYFSLFMDNSAVPDYYSFFNKIEYKQFLKKYPYAEIYLDTTIYSGYIVIDTDGIGSLQKNKLGAALDIVMGNTSDRLQLRWDDYNSIPGFSWVEGDFWNYLNNRVSVVSRGDHWKGVLTNVLSRNKSRVQTSMDKFGQYADSLRFSFKSKDSLNTLSRDILVPMYLCTQQIVRENNQNVLQDSYKSLISVIKYLKSRQIRLIFYTSPVYKSFTDNYDVTLIKIMRGTMLKLVGEYNIEYYDFSSDSSLIFNNKLFYNSDHLNRYGAAEFSRKLQKEIGTI